MCLDIEEYNRNLVLTCVALLAVSLIHDIDILLSLLLLP